MFNCSQISQSESWEGVITCQEDGELLGLIFITSYASKTGLKIRKINEKAKMKQILKNSCINIGRILCILAILMSQKYNIQMVGRLSMKTGSPSEMEKGGWIWVWIFYYQMRKGIDGRIEASTDLWRSGKKSSGHTFYPEKGASEFEIWRKLQKRKLRLLGCNARKAREYLCMSH